MKQALNKHRLNQLQQDLELYRRYLPALDLKRQQLMARQKLLLSEMSAAQADLETSINQLHQQFPWLRSQRVKLSDVIQIEHTGLIEKKVMGVTMVMSDPNDSLVFSPFNSQLKQTIGSEQKDPVTKVHRPYWLPMLYQALKPLASQQLHLKVLEINLARLKVATKKATQKVNLFSKVMIPDTEKGIREIKLFLGDQEKAAVMRAKLAKTKQQQNQVYP